MNQSQTMLKNMLVMTIADVKQMYGLTLADVVAVLTAVAEDPALEDFQPVEVEVPAEPVRPADAGDTDVPEPDARVDE
mgnify:FL=1